MSEIKVDTVAEKTSANGVTIDGLSIKDSKLVTANSVVETNLTNDIVTLAKMAAGTDGNIISYDASGNPVAIATGNDGQVLTSTGAGSPPAFETISTTPANNSITNDKLAAGAFAKITGTGTLAGFTSTGIDDDASQSILKLLSGNQVRIVSDKSADLVFNLQNTTNSNPYGMAIDFTAAAPDNNSRYFIKGADSGADRFYIWSDGDVQNHDNSYGAISDQRIKSNIVDANSQWNDIKSVKVRNYKKNDDIEIYGNNAATELGVVAQELEASNMSGLVKDEVLYEAIDKEVIDGNKNVGDIKHYKSVKYSILYMKAIKALQEAMTKIEDLETRITTLENA